MWRTRSLSSRPSHQRRTAPRSAQTASQRLAPAQRMVSPDSSVSWLRSRVRRSPSASAASAERSKSCSARRSVALLPTRRSRAPRSVRCGARSARRVARESRRLVRGSWLSPPATQMHHPTPHPTKSRRVPTRHPVIGSAPVAVSRRAKRAGPAARCRAAAQRRPGLCGKHRPGHICRLAEAGRGWRLHRAWSNAGGAYWRANRPKHLGGCFPYTSRSRRGWASPTALTSACVPSRCCGSSGSRRPHAGQRCRTGCSWLRRWHAQRTGARCSTRAARCGWLWSGCCWGSRRSWEAATWVRRVATTHT